MVLPRDHSAKSSSTDSDGEDQTHRQQLLRPPMPPPQPPPLPPPLTPLPPVPVVEPEIQQERPEPVQHAFRDLENQMGEHQEHLARNLGHVQAEIRNVTRQVLEAVDAHQKALDDLVNVNSLFTIATFVGLSLAQPGERSLDDRADCEPDNDMGKRLVVSEVVAFSFFLLSSLVAKTLKVHLNIYRERDFKDIRLKVVRGVMLLLSAWGSILGCVFLTTSMVEVIQIKVGRLSCGSMYAFRAVGALLGIVLVGLGIYVPFMMHAIYVSMKKVYA